MNDYRLNRTVPKVLTEKEMKTIEKRQKLALLYRSKEKIEDYQDQVFEIIDNKGLKNDDNKTSLDTALKILPYIIPTKKAIETTVIHKTIEDIIKNDVEEAEIIENDENSPNNDNDDSNN